MHSSQECEDSLGPLKRDASLLVLLKLEVEGEKKEKERGLLRPTMLEFVAWLNFSITLFDTLPQL